MAAVDVAYMPRCERAVVRERIRREVNEYRDTDAVCSIAAYSGAPQCCMSAEGTKGASRRFSTSRRSASLFAWMVEPTMVFG